MGSLSHFSISCVILRLWWNFVKCMSNFSGKTNISFSFFQIYKHIPRIIMCLCWNFVPKRAPFLPPQCHQFLTQNQRDTRLLSHRNAKLQMGWNSWNSQWEARGLRLHNQDFILCCCTVCFSLAKSAQISQRSYLFNTSAMEHRGGLKNVSRKGLDQLMVNKFTRNGNLDVISGLFSS